MLLEIKNLSVGYRRENATAAAVRGVSLAMNSGETLGLIGESGCGKSTLALSIVRLLAENAVMLGGEIIFEGQNLTALSPEKLRVLRGQDIGVVFQDPFSSLNPVLSLGEQTAEAIRAHHPELSEKALREKVLGLYERVKLPEPERMWKSYPHQISGGQRQRVMIAIAISNNPKLLIADEPTTALDVTVQKEILDLLKNLQKDLGMALILVTHHFGVLSYCAQKTAVLYAGALVEFGETQSLLKNPLHPYTQALLQSLPGHARAGEKLMSIAGSPPELSRLPAGCSFHPRCSRASAKCLIQEPALQDFGAQKAACIHVQS